MTPNFAQLDDWIHRKLALDRTPGLSLVITDREQTLHTGVYGLADVATGTPVNERHAFEIGSIGKSFTALVLLRLEARGLIDLQAPVSDYLPWFAVRSDHAPITVHHLMTHTAGIIEGSDMAADGRYEAWHLRETGVLGPPGEHFSYSNVGYKTLGYLIEDLLGRPYGAVVTEEILAPLGMTGSFTPITNTDRHRLAVAHRWPSFNRPHRPGDTLVPDTWIETFTADGSIASTPRDMAIYARMLLNRGAGVIADEQFERMLHASHPESGLDPGATYGYGLATWEENGRRVFCHEGGMIGYFAALTMDAEAGIGVAVMVNGPGLPEEVAAAALVFARALADGTTPELPPLHPPSVIENAADYAGVFSGDAGVWTIVAEGPALWLERDRLRTRLERRITDCFFADAPDLQGDLVRFERNDDAVVALHHGVGWCGREGIEHESAQEAPAHWAAFVGPYHSHNPWLPDFRVISRRGKLSIMTVPWRESPLVEQSEGLFQVGESPSAEYLRFDAIAGSLALRADLSGQMYYRTPVSSIRPH